MNVKYEVILKLPNPGHTRYHALDRCFEVGEPVELDLDEAQLKALKAEKVLFQSDLVDARGYPVPQVLLEKKGQERFILRPVKASSKNG
ncbi:MULTISPECIES: hypothetical protein [Sorangium]|uniref:Uncharacterized protein n=1 Tax=Sorangium cellulosum TaxID=56 RepID=A0A4P2QQ05_SORCE|nr:MULTISPECIES: hypothetical protein [Sorangium]AUX31931.1 uncharacterized protein SOCE836_040660 [Sorangium cellulosum]WCQ91305.1 hypothetical protein NQZ70_04021 [Sorangium sp. Soce836]